MHLTISYVNLFCSSIYFGISPFALAVLFMLTQCSLLVLYCGPKYLAKKRIIHHIHETSYGGQLFTKLLKLISSLTATHRIYVSDTHMNASTINPMRNNFVINNCISADIYNYSLSTQPPINSSSFNICMLCSWRSYKGVEQFIELAKILSSDGDIKFLLCLNESIEITRQLALTYDHIKCLQFLSSTDNPSSVYRDCHLNLNLSTKHWIETFGLTIVESMAFGVPSIVPNIGHPPSLIQDGYNGFTVDTSNIKTIVDLILRIKTDMVLYQNLSKNSRQESIKYSPQLFKERIVDFFSNLE